MYTKYLSTPPRPKFLPLYHYDQSFLRYTTKLSKIPQSTLYRVSTYPRGRTFDLFLSTTSRFEIQNKRLFKIGKAPDVIWLILNTWQWNSQKYPAYTKYVPQGPRFWFCFVSPYDQPYFEIQSCWKSEKHGMTSKWLKYLIVKRILYTLSTYTRCPHFGSFCLQPVFKWPQIDPNT